jgi:hypothetical protein
MKDFEIRQAIKNLKLKPEFESLISKLVSAETFNARRLYDADFTFSIEEKTRPDLRVFLIVKMEIKNEDVSIHVLRPFSDESARIMQNKDAVTIIKSYMIYER